MEDLFIFLEYNIEIDSFKVTTNIKEDKVEDIVSEYLQCQIGSGIDKSPRNEFDLYKIHISLDIYSDSFKCRDNCGNRGLRDGILMHFLNNENRYFDFDEMFKKEDFMIG